MRVAGRRNSPKQWARLAMKVGLLATDPKVWADINESMSQRADDVRDELREKYDRAGDRLRDASRALRGDSGWAVAASFLGGAVVGAGLGLLFAPMSGEQTRATIRDKAWDVRRKVNDLTSADIRSGSMATGTDGD
jgi:hypothetical protein